MAARLSPFALIVGLVFLTNLILVSPELTPVLQELNPYDESKYIDSGRTLVHGELRGFEWSPMSSFVYAPIYLLVRDSPDWFIWTAAIGRHVLFAFLWFSFFFLGMRLRHAFRPMVLAGVLFVATTFTEIVRNPSDALFAATSALALERLLAFEDHRRLRDVWLASGFMGLAALSRNDGLFLFPTFMAATAYLGFRNRQLSQVIRPALLPAATLVIGYLLLGFVTEGSLRLGTGYRGLTAYIWSLERTRGLSSAEVSELLAMENSPPHSFVGAVLRNPKLLASQVVVNSSRVPDVTLSAYGKRLGPLLFLLALVGAYTFWWRREYFRLCLLALWPAHSLIYLGFYLRGGFVLLHHHIVFLLTAAGIYFLVREIRGWRAQILWSSPFLALALYGALDEKLAFFASGLVFLIALWLGWVAMSPSDGIGLPSSAVLAMLLIAGIILRDGYPFPNYPPIGRTSMDQANHFLQNTLPEGAGVLAEFPQPAIAARMVHVGWSRIRDGIEQGIDNCEILANKNVKAFLVTPDAVQRQPGLWEYILEVEGICVDRAFVVDPGSIQVFLVRE